MLQLDVVPWLLFALDPGVRAFLLRTARLCGADVLFPPAGLSRSTIGVARTYNQPKTRVPTSSPHPPRLRDPVPSDSARLSNIRPPSH